MRIIINNYGCKPKKKNCKYDVKTTDQLLSLMNIYYSEWAHRDSLMWKQITTFFFAIFIIILLPYAKIWEISLSDKIPNYVFPIVGILLNFVFLYVSMQYAKRLSKISQTYRELIELLPQDLQRKKIYNKNSIGFARRLGYTIPLILFFALLVFGIFILVLCFI